MRRPTIREKIPEHLHAVIAEQDPSLYTAIDHSGWRYLIRVSKAFFADHAHQKYIKGLEETGISSERVPLISEMDAKLSHFGWRAVAVVGFIPPSAFMELLSLGVLPIACDFRSAAHLAYTPAPDIFHEAAGHAPIIADNEYADYLSQYGEIARKVIFSSQDLDVYEAIRALSDIKEDPKSTAGDIERAQKNLDAAVAAVDWVSEATQLSRMGWWTFEYGLVGSLNSPKIYGAGLLSSVGESYNCLKDEVKKIPFSIDCINMSYDITRPQPQLYVTPDFETLAKVLEQLAGQMAFKIGGLEALKRAQRAATVTTTELDSGMQISGKLVDVRTDSRGQPYYLRYDGPVQLAQGETELEGHSVRYHAHGFSTPIGKLVNFDKSPAELTDDEIARLKGRMEFTSGVIVEGRFKGVLRQAGRALVLSFENCTVRKGDEILFKPEWGTFDLACGVRAVSVFGGAADRARYMRDIGGYAQRPASQKTNRDAQDPKLIALYERVRESRESGKPDIRDLAAVHDELERAFPNDWLLRLELLEFRNAPWEGRARARLKEIAAIDKVTAELIERGLRLL